MSRRATDALLRERQRDLGLPLGPLALDAMPHQELYRLMKPLETGTCPFRVRPQPNERPHWIEPRLVAEVNFSELTADGKLRAPAYVGLSVWIARRLDRQRWERYSPVQFRR